MHNQALPIRTWKMKCLLLTGGMLFIFLLDNLPLGTYIDHNTYIYVLKPLLWIFIANLYRWFPRNHPVCPLRIKETIMLWGVIFAIINIFVLIGAGLFDGFGKSPYNQSIKGIAMNVVMIGSMLLGRETARGFIVNHLLRKEKYSLFIILSLLFTMLNYPISKFTALKNLEEVVQFMAQYFAPDFCQNLLATYLAFLGGWAPAISYMGILEAFHWLSPVLPNLQWITSAFVGTLCPVFSFNVIQNVYMKESGELKSKKFKEESTLGWVITSVLSIGIIWFCVGVFQIYPSVVATGSMEPVINPGDVILIEKISKMEDIDALREGDIIHFKRDDIFITHRIIKIVQEEQLKTYRTKGDNNSGPDSILVKPENIKGKIVYVFPKIGWPTLLIKKKNDNPIEGVEF